MRRPRIVFLSLVSVLLLAILALGLSLDARSNLTTPLTPIPASALAAFKPGEPITTPIQAFVAAQFYLGTTRLRAAGEILPYSAESIPFTEAIARTGTFTDLTAYRIPLPDMKVWLVLFEGGWYIDPPVPETTPAAPGAGCVFVILNPRVSEGMRAGGIRPCSHYQVRPAMQIIQVFFQAKGLTAFPGPQAYGQFMKGILLGDYPELTGDQPTLVHNRAELEALLEYAAQHLQDGTWYFGEPLIKPDVPEALPPTPQP